MNEFKTSVLNKKYSIPVHKNRADLMAELNNINIMGDESDVEFVEPSTKDNEQRAGLNAANTALRVTCSQFNGRHSTDSSISSETSDSNAGERDSDPTDEEGTLTWAQNHSQSLAVNVASILSDHDYLSQENLHCIIKSNEESFENKEMEKQSEKQQREIIDTAILNSALSKEQNTDSQKTIIYTQETNGNDVAGGSGGDAAAIHSSSDTEKLASNDDISDLKDILQKLQNSKSEDKSALYDQILEKVNQLKLQTADIGKDPKEKCTSENQSNTASEFSSNHSEPLEYDGGTKYSTQTSIEEAKESDNVAGDDVMEIVKNDVKFVEDIALRISMDTKSIRNRLAEMENQPEKERLDAIREISRNFGLLVEDMANELNKTAVKFNPNKPTDKSPNKKLKNWSHNSSSTEDELTDSDESSKQRLRKLKRRRKMTKSRANMSGENSSNSEELPNRIIKDEPYIISQDFDDLMNGGTSNSANESLTKENDLLGFDHVNDVEIGIKTEAMLNSEPAILSQDATKSSDKCPNQSNSDQTGEYSLLHKSTDNITDMTKNSAIKEMEDDSTNSTTTDFEDVDDDDKEMYRLLNFKSFGSRRIASSSSTAQVNGVVQPPKAAIKKPEKEDTVSKFLAKNTDDTEKAMASEGDTSESEEKEKEKDTKTEEQYLKEENLKLKAQFLQSSSDSEETTDDSDDDGVNGKESLYTDSDVDDKSKASYDSDQSLVTKFLASDSGNLDEKSPSNDIKKKSKTKNIESSKLVSDDEAENSPKMETKESTPKKSETEKIERFDVDSTDSDFDFDNDSVSANASDVPRKSKSTVGKNLFATLEKDNHISVLASDDEDISGDDEKKKPVSKKKAESTDANSSGNSVEILDTSMFKAAKKDYNPQQLSRILQSNRSKQSTSRVSPECISLSSDDDIEMESTVAEKKDDNDDDDEEKEKRVKRKLLRPDQLADDTKQAQKEEQERIKRLDKKNERLTQFIKSQRASQEDIDEPADPNEVVLDFDTKRNEKIFVHPEITKHLKAHQVEGLRFMYDCCYGSADSLDKFPGSGCILAHCMGLGKTLQLITLLHTVICYPQLKTDKVLVICPKSTVMNWKDEIERWLGQIKNTRRLKLFHFPESSDINSKLKTLKDWSQCGKADCKQAGCLLLGYEAFRSLVFYHNSKKSRQSYTDTDLEKLRKNIHKYILDPGADLVVCDEGHMIKNQKSTTSMAVNKIMTKRRIVLTGTPIQNNLKEYYSMVNFIKPSFLGTEKEFANLYVNPIKNGQHKDSSKSEIKYMKQRSYVLHKKLSRFVQRREAALLKSFLPDKFEYVLFIPMTDIQTNLYEYFLENRPNQDQKGKNLIPDYTVLRKIWTHPKVLENAYLNAKNKTIKLPATTANANDSDDDQPDDVFDSQTGKMSVTSDWWRAHLSKDDLETILPSSKLKILFEILDQCRRNKEKCLIFSAFVAVLDVVDFFMRKIHEQDKSGNKPGLEKFRGPWTFGQDYYRLDGKTPKTQRHSMIKSFNNPKNERTRVFLISAKAGGQGINLIGANRVILLDTSWNPSNDQQNIFRVFRLGQKRICYIYRLISMGTMEEKVYSRSVTKQAMSCRVMDEQQIDRHYNMAELTELYILTKPSMAERPTPNVPKDDLLAYLLMNFPHMVYKYHEHDSLLENKGEEELSEQEKNDAWTAYEEDVKRKNETNMGQYNNSFGMLPNYPALGSYANSLFNNYNNLTGVSGLNYPYNMYNQYPYANESHWQFNDYTSFYNNLMTMGRSTMNNYNQSSTNLLSPNNSTSVSSPPPASPSPSSLLNMSNFSSARNWMQPNASPSGYTNSLLSSLAQQQSSSSSSKNSYASYLNSLYNALGPTPNVPGSATAANASTSKTPPPIPLTSGNFNTLAFLQKQNLANIGGASTLSGSASLASNSSAQQGPNALRNPLLTKELSIPRIPTLSNSNLFNVPAHTSVITNATTSTSSALSSILSASSAGSSANDTNKPNQKSTDPNNSSSLEKSGKKITQKPPTDSNQLIIKDVRTINNESRESPDTTTTTASSKAASIATSNSTNIGIAYPQQKTTPTVLVPIDMKTRDKDPPRNQVPSTSGLTVSKSSNQPMAAIIHKPPQSNAKQSDPTNDAVAAINKNKALTVTARSVATTVPKAPPVAADVNNTFTLSPITSSKPAGNSITITRQLVQQTKENTSSALSPLSKASTASPIPVAISKATLNQTTNSKSPTPVSKPNGLGFRSSITNANTSTKSNTMPKIPNSRPTVSSSATRATANNNRTRAPIIPSKILVSTQTSKSPAFTPIIAQTKRAQQALTAQNTIKPNLNVVSKVKTASPIITQQQARANTFNNTSKLLANKLNAIGGLEVRKRPATETLSILTAKKQKNGNNTTSSSSQISGTQKSQNPLQGIRMTARTTPKPTVSQITPVEIVELE